MGNELQTVLEHMDRGFGGVHERLNKICQQCSERQVSCLEKFSAITRDMEVKAAVMTERKKHNYWPSVVNSIIVILTGAAVAFIWKAVLHVEIASTMMK